MNDWFVVASPSPILPHLNRKLDIDILDSSLTYLGLPKSNCGPRISAQCVSHSMASSIFIFEK